MKQATRRVLALIATFATKVLKSAWVFAGILVIHTLVILAFWVLPQGRDVVSCASESASQILTSGLAVVFWSFASWYCARLLAYARNDMYTAEQKEIMDRVQDGTDEEKEAAKKKRGTIMIIFQVLPRLLGYLCYTIAIIMLYMMSRFEQKPFATAVIAASISIATFFVVKYFIEKHDTFFEKHYRQKLIGCGIIFALTIATPALYKYWFVHGLDAGVTVTAICLIVGQLLFLIIVTYRKKWFEAWGLKRSSHSRTMSAYVKLKTWLYDRTETILRKVNGRHLHPELEKYRNAEVLFLFVFNALSMLCTVIFICAFSHPGVARSIGSLAIVLLGLTLIMGACNIITIISIYKKWKLYFFLFLLAFVSGIIWEPHRIKMEQLESSNHYEQRQDVEEYLRHWVDAHESEFADSTHKVPMYFVLANGGASRSGYWVANVLNALDTATHAQFGKHLFCLSGASGGSVGNAAYFAQLHAADDAPPVKKLQQAQRYLGSDFLSYSAAKMLGPDMLNFVFSGFHFNDRARGLQQGMQQTDASPALSNAMAQNFSSYITRQGNASPLPILFVNSTRMQDGKPGVFSTIKLHSLKTERIDICAQMNNKQDVTLACAVVNGARFPYLSPAGAMCDTSGHWQYFVDGGYFDNSGAGIVHELLHEVLGLMETPEYADIKQRVVIRVVHITNSEWGPGIEQGRLHHVNTMKNDLAAPFITLLGSYSMQTSVNDFRLKNYVQDHEGATDVYLKIPLLKEGESGEAFTMNWVISKHVRDKMDSRLDSAGFSTASQVIKKDFR